LRGDGPQKGNGLRTRMRPMLFPAVVLAVYLILLIVLPDKALLAFKSCGSVFRALLLPLCLVLAVMLLMNLFVRPAQIVRFLGRGAGLKGVLLSVVAGLISMGPIYAWYPLLKDLKGKGATDSLLAVFLYNRAVKPFLLPVMVAYFGWLYAAVLTVLTVLASVVVGFLVGLFVRGRARTTA
jgi:uncharacterized membrane protein YraQ (UPF0718 family)